ncbi:cupin domain-containing protein [Paraburkholderia gardini]|uniref:Cupin type-2 domain-containing protein n=1 Tax=Paraburkholderia gardini TaxID=2823469 RepID=A0ABN7QMR5_9BURK|nr:cupin domain-containing protein [Paraburkholderia gardini]CAG4909514.1 hypothetical protein R54767_03606 [Paraburkholderia gardini]
MQNEMVFSMDDMPWRNLKELPAARGFKYKALVCDDPGYTDTYSCELVALGPEDHSVAHREEWNHTLIFLEGQGELTIRGQKWTVTKGSVAKVKAGDVHLLTNTGDEQMLVLTIYDPPRPREKD